MKIETTFRDGVEYATIPKEELDALMERLEDLDDIRAADEVAGRIASGDEQLIPAEFANRLIDGEVPVKVYREFRGLNQSELSRASGVNRVYISDIEAGRKSGSVDALSKLAASLGVTIDDLVP